MTLINKLLSSSQVDCPRCLGKGEVDQDDLKRLNRTLTWLTGPCAYCNGKGKVSGKMPSQVSPDNMYLTLELSQAERKRLINKDEGALRRAKVFEADMLNFIKEIEFLHFRGHMDAPTIAEFCAISEFEEEAFPEEKQELLDYIKKVISELQISNS